MENIVSKSCFKPKALKFFRQVQVLIPNYAEQIEAEIFRIC